jgi:cytochrome c peroxidase
MKVDYTPGDTSTRLSVSKSDPAYALGKLLFFDPALSVNYKRSCASCHRPQKAFTDHRQTARAFRFSANLDRNTPTILNAAQQTTFFHDGRAGSLQAVIESVLTNPREFNNRYDTVVYRLGSSPVYRRLFRQAFNADINSETISRALEAYISRQVTQNSRFDQAVGGTLSLTTAERAGQQLFTHDLNCVGCHPAPWFRDGRRHEVGPGLFIKTPGLRNVALTPPYRADGTAPTMEAALSDPVHQRQRRRALTNRQQADLIAFLNALTDTTSADTTEPPTLPPLTTGRNRAVGGIY